MSCFFGIDNGKSGAIAVIRNGDVEVHDMPVIAVKKGKSQKTIYDIQRIVSIIYEMSRHDDTYGILEQAQVMHFDGKVSAGTIMYSFGLMEGVLSALGVRYEIKHPKTWQKEYFHGVIGDSTKEKSYKVASRLYPGVELVTPRGRVYDGRCDALLMADLAKRNFGQ